MFNAEMWGRGGGRWNRVMKKLHKVGVKQFPKEKTLVSTHMGTRELYHSLWSKEASLGGGVSIPSTVSIALCIQVVCSYIWPMQNDQALQHSEFVNAGSLWLSSLVSLSLHEGKSSLQPEKVLRGKSEMGVENFHQSKISRERNALDWPARSS